MALTISYKLFMYNFFIDSDSIQGDYCHISGSDYNHIKNVLRMETGDRFLVSLDGISRLCRLESLDGGQAAALIIDGESHSTELPLKIHLFQGLPKGDKTELIIQKATELGVNEIIPVEMSRCVVRLDDKKKKTKQSRWQAIAESAAKQSKRSRIPTVSEVMPYSSALEKAKELELIIVPYEAADGMLAAREILTKLKDCKSVGIFIGPEGGFDKAEIEAALNAGAKTFSLGKRILRTETAAILSVGMCMLAAEINSSGDCK